MNTLQYALPSPRTHSDVLEKAIQANKSVASHNLKTLTLNFGIISIFVSTVALAILLSQAACLAVVTTTVLTGIILISKLKDKEDLKDFTLVFRRAQDYRGLIDVTDLGIVLKISGGVEDKSGYISRYVVSNA